VTRVRGEMAALGAALRVEVAKQIGDLRAEISCAEPLAALYGVTPAYEIRRTSLKSFLLSVGAASRLGPWPLA
jgi:hypothetical protein